MGQFMSLLRLPAWLRTTSPFGPIQLLATEAETPDSSRAARTEVAGAAAPGLDDFETFFTRHEREVVGYLWRMTGEEQAARDLTQETFLRTWQRFDQVRAYDQPKAWLFRVATHLATGAKARQAWSQSEHATQSDPGMRIVNQDAVLQTLQTLSPRDRAALVLHSVYGLTCAELGRSLGISRSAAKVTLWRARERFRSEHQRSEERS
jgi:RNA polymerase sigma-70 factor, ECF subfamily